MSYLNVFISFIALAFIIFFHELGHFLFCRYFGIAVEAFSIGFGGSLFSYRDKYNTNWILGCITIGGYVMPLEHSMDSSNDKLCPIGIGMEENHPLKNIAIAFAGPLFNFILSFGIILILILTMGVPEMKYEVSHVKPISVASFHGIKRGDFIIDVVTNERGETFKGLNRPRIKNGSVITILRNKEIIQKKIKLDHGQKFDGLGYKYSYTKIGFIGSVIKSFQQLIGSIVLALMGIFILFKSLFLRLIGYGTENLYMNISGTVGILNATNYALKNGLADFFIILSQISVSLGVFNLLPIPMLDGGQILIYFLEFLIGRKLDRRIRDILMILSLGLMLSLFIFSTFLDLVRLKVFF